MDKDNVNSPRVFAGQAGSGYYPQNSIAAASFSLELGVTGIEVCVQQTRDRVLVCHNTAKLNPAFTQNTAGKWLTRDEQWPIARLSYTQLCQLLQGELNPEYDTLKKPLRQMAIAQPIPALLQMLEMLVATPCEKKLAVLLHLPADITTEAIDLTLLDQVLSDTADYKDKLDISYTSFDWRLLQAIKKRQPLSNCWYRLHPPAYYQPNWGDAVTLSNETAFWVTQGWAQRQLPWLANLQPVDYADIITQAQSMGWPLLCHHTALPYLTASQNYAVWTEQQHEPTVYTQLRNANPIAIITDSPFSYAHLSSAKCEALANFGKQSFEKKAWQAVVDKFLPVVEQSAACCHFDLVYRLAIALRRLQRFEESEQILMLGLKAYPNHHNIYIELAALENQRENWQQALQYWYKAFHIAEAFSIMSYQRLTKAIIMSTDQQVWFAKAFYKASSTAHSNPYFAAYFSYFLLTHEVTDAALPAVIEKITALQNSNFLYQYGVPHLYTLQQMKLRLAVVQQRELDSLPLAWNSLLKTDKPTRLMPQDIASLQFMLPHLAKQVGQEQANFYHGLLQAIEPLTALAKTALINLCTFDAYDKPAVMTTVEALHRLFAEKEPNSFKATWLPEQAWLILSNIMLLRFNIAEAFTLRALAIQLAPESPEYQASLPDSTSLVQLPPLVPLQSNLGTERSRVEQQSALTQFLRGQISPFLHAYQHLHDDAYAATIKGKRIALVGPVDVGLKQGELIDKYDLVIRLNYRKPSHWNTKNAGSRTDISYYANDLILADDTDPQLIAGMQQLKWVVFDTKNNLPDNIHLAQQRCQLPYRECNPAYKGYLNAIQKVILDLLLHQPASISVFNCNLWLTDNTIAGYHVGHQRNQVSRFIWHDPASNFLFMQHCFRNGFIQADPVLSSILSNSVLQYITKLDAVIQPQEN
ncbi:glycerophosphodiester phosphodiesterase family protein [Alishewanella longhuensis]